ncbi:adenylate cyclase [Acrasis kona]|uniref:Adenylate cyclase n=1 Tax=Acrasis kona TaxID=1008807 RepID=A0AAW2ZR95_9EUKA
MHVLLLLVLLLAINSLSYDNALSSTLYFGMSGQFTATSSAGQVSLGINAGFQEANSKFGGAAGRPLALVTVQDDDNETNTTFNTIRFSQNSSIIGLMGYTGLYSSLSSAQAIQGQNIPFFCPTSGAEQLRNSSYRHVINMKASYFDECSAIVNYMINALSVREIAVIYSTDAATSSINQYLNKISLQSSTPVKYSCMFSSTPNTCINQMSTSLSGVESIIILADSEGTISAINTIKINNVTSPFVKPNDIHLFTTSLSFDNNVNITSRLVSVENVHTTSAIWSPSDSTTDYIKSYQSAISAFSPGTPLTTFSLEGYLCSQLVVQALQQAVYSAGTNNSLFYIRDLAVGPFSSICNQGSRAVYLSNYSKSSFLRPMPEWTYAWPKGSCYADPSNIIQPIVFGQSIPLSTNLKSFAIDYMNGLKGAFNDYNTRGGYNGRKVQLDVLDDSGDSDIMLNNTKYFADTIKVVGIVGYFTSTVISPSLPTINARAIPFMGVYTGSNAFRSSNPFMRNYINLRMGNNDDFATSIAYLIRTKAITRISFLYQSDSITSLTSFTRILSDFSLVPESLGAYTFGSLNVTDAYISIAKGNPEAIITGGQADVSAALVTLIKRDPLKIYQNPSQIIFVLNSISSPYYAARYLASYKPTSDYTRNVFMTEVVPVPYSTNIALFQTWTNSMKSFSPQLLTSTNFEGYLMGRVIISNLLSMQYNASMVTRSKFLDHLYNAQSYLIDGYQIGNYADQCNATTGTVCCNTGMKSISLVSINQNAKNTSTLYTDLIQTAPYGTNSITINKCSIDVSSFTTPIVFGIVGTGLNDTTSSFFRYVIGMKAAFYGEDDLSVGNPFLKTYDDFGSLSTNNALLDLMWRRDKVVAVVGHSNQNDHQITNTMSIFNYSINFIAPLSGSMTLRYPFRPNIINYRASIRDEVATMLKFLTNARIKKFIIASFIVSTTSTNEDGIKGFLEIGSANYGVSPTDIIRFTEASSNGFMSRLKSASEETQAIVIFGNTTHAFNIINATKSLGAIWMVSNDMNFNSLTSTLTRYSDLRPIIPNVYATRSLPPFDINLAPKFPTMNAYVSEVSDSTFLSEQGLDPTKWKTYLGTFGFEGYVVGKYLTQVLRSVSTSAISKSRAINVDQLRRLFLGLAFNTLPTSQGDIIVGSISSSCEDADTCCNQITRGLFMQTSTVNSDTTISPTSVANFSFVMSACGVVLQSSPTNILPYILGPLIAFGALCVVILIGILIWAKVSRSIKIGNAPKSGRMAVAFTDVQSSTSLWQQFPNEMGRALKKHNLILRKLISKFNGYEVKTQGDSFMVCFANPYDAVDWAVNVQKELLDCESWPTELIVGSYDCRMEWDDLKNIIFKGLRVRIGIHFGEAEKIIDPTTNRPDYFGTTVNKAARVESVASGGQIVISFRLLKAIADDVINIETGDKAVDEKWFSEMLEEVSSDERTTLTGSLSNSNSRQGSTNSLNLSMISTGVSEKRKRYGAGGNRSLLYYRSIGEHALKGLAGKELLFSISCHRLSCRKFDKKDAVDPMADRELDFTLPTSPSDAELHSYSPSTPQSHHGLLRTASNKVLPSSSGPSPYDD